MELYTEIESKNSLSDKLKQSIIPGQTINGLVDILKEYNISNLEESVKLIRKIWKKQQPPRLKILSQEPPKPLPHAVDSIDVSIFPSETVVYNRNKIHIHGVPHGRNEHEEGGNYQFREQLRKYVDYSLKKGEEWYTEQNFLEHFVLPVSCYPLHDVSTYKAREEEFDKHLPWLKKFIRNFTDPDFDIHIRDAENLIDGTKLSHKFEVLYQKLKEKFIINPDYFLLIHDFYNLIKLPEPLDMEIKIAKIIPPKDIPTHRNLAISRSQLQAFEVRAQQRAKKTHDKPAHVLVGMEHESQVAYFLRNPGYDPIASLTMAIKALK